MKKITSITIVDDVTLISLQDFPANIELISHVFDLIAKADIDVDMISQTSSLKVSHELSFTVKGEEFGKILEKTASLRESNPNLKINVSNGNCKLSVFGEGMKGCPGVAAKVFAAAKKASADIMMITTSEYEISLLVVKADADNTVKALTQEFKEE